MDQPGVEVRPIRNMAGYSLFNEVFFTDARTAAHEVVGGVNDGWRTAMALLGFERGVTATTDAIRFRAELDRLFALARERGLTSDPRVRDRLAWCHGRVEVMRFRGYQALTRSLNGARPGPESAISKIIWSEYAQAYTELAMEILGPEALTHVRPAHRRPAADAGARHGEHRPQLGRDVHVGPRRDHLRRQLAGAAQHHRRAAARAAQGAAPGRRPVPRAREGTCLTWTSPTSADQEELRTTVRRFLADQSPLAKVREDVATDLGYDPALWRQMAEQLGLPGLHLPEEHGGSGTGLLEPAVVLEETGRALTSSPYTAVLFASLAVLHLGSEEHRRPLLPGLAGGETVATLATGRGRQPDRHQRAADHRAVARRPGHPHRHQDPRRARRTAPTCCSSAPPATAAPCSCTSCRATPRA